jgi:hypothetical protein
MHDAVKVAVVVSPAVACVPGCRYRHRRALDGLPLAGHPDVAVGAAGCDCSPSMGQLLQQEGRLG